MLDEAAAEGGQCPSGAAETVGVCFDAVPLDEQEVRRTRSNVTAKGFGIQAEN